MTQHGRRKGTKAQKTIILDYRSWIIEYDGSSWPSDCFILKKKRKRAVAYYGSLEAALKKMHRSMLGDYASCTKNYGAKFEDLANMITAVNNDLSDLFQFPCTRNCIKKITEENGREDTP